MNNESNSQSVIDIGLSVRSENGLRKNGVQTVADMLKLKYDDLMKMRHLGKKSAEEIMVKIEELSNNKDAELSPFSDFNAWSKLRTSKEIISNYFKKDEIYLKNVQFSTRAYNALLGCKVRLLSELVILDLNLLSRSPNVGSSTIKEIDTIIKNYIRLNREGIQNYISRNDLGSNVSKDNSNTDTEISMDILEMATTEKYRFKIKEYLIENDIVLSQLALPSRTINALESKGINHFSHLFDFYPNFVLSLNGVGEKGLQTVFGYLDDYLLSNQDNIKAYCSGDFCELSDAYLEGVIIRKFNESGFEGYAFKQIMEWMPNQIREDRIKKLLGKLINEHQLEYVDWRCYRVYPSIFDYIDEIDVSDDRNLAILRKRLDGMTLEEIAVEMNITRERVRQISVKQLKQVQKQFFTEKCVEYFDEDYYKYIFTNYSIDKEVYIDFLRIEPKKYFYLVERYKKGSSEIENVFDDPKITLNLKLKIQRYLNKDKVQFGKDTVKKTRLDIENYLIQNYCKEDITYDDFVILYNGFLEKHGIDFDEQLYLVESVSRTRENRLRDASNVLYKQGRKFRYYDIEGTNFEELLSTLNLESYKNTEVSTLKFIRDYPECMEKYDIRDQYELHNLLKKIVKIEDLNDVHFSRMPDIEFGQFDRDNAIYDLILKNGPISQSDLAKMISEEFGYLEQTICLSYLGPFAKYCSKGIYSIESNIMQKEKLDLLKSHLTEDFYFFSEIEQVYKSLNLGMDASEINSYNLKAMGFKVYSKYVVRNQTAESYFSNLLLKDNVYDLTPLRSRYGYLTTFTNLLMNMKKQYELIEFEPNQIINISKLENAGVNKSAINEFCDDVFEFLGNQNYFTVKSLVNRGFTSSLFDLGFQDWFYSNLIAMDERFAYSKVFNNILIYKGDTKQITMKTFLVNLVNEEGSIDIYDLISDLENIFGMTNIEKHRIIESINGTDVYYDQIMEKLYSSVDHYYTEIESEEF